MNGLPTLQTTRLVLRPYTVEFIDALHALWTDPHVRRYLWDDVLIPRERAEETVRESIALAGRERLGQWIVTPRGQDTVIGFCGFLRRADGDAPELLYGLAPAWWGRGLATEAAHAALEYVFREIGAPRVTAATDPPNRASVRVMERVGMRFTGRGTLNGLDTLFYEITTQEWEAATRAAGGDVSQGC